MIGHWFTLLFGSGPVSPPGGAREVWRGTSRIARLVLADSAINTRFAAASAINARFAAASAIATRFAAASAIATRFAAASAIDMETPP